jgi:putative SOS response-associated peptidase YedK
MCGRFTLRTPMALLVPQFMADAPVQMALRYNIAPTQEVVIVRKTSEESPRQFAIVRWGLIPSWSKDAKLAGSLINARSETIAEKPSFRTAFKKRRCLVIADGYYEWPKTPAGGKSSAKKQPYYITMQDERPFAFAGLWETWGGPKDAQPATPIETCTIITTETNELTRDLHDRMPVILRPEDYDLWLDPALQESAPLLPLLVPFAADEMKLQAVSTHVNSVRNDDASCVAPERGLF